MSFTVLVVILMFISAPFLANEFKTESLSQPSLLIKNEIVMDLQLPTIEDLAEDSRSFKLAPTKGTIVLNSENMLVFKGPVTAKSVAEAQVKLLKMSHKLKRSDVIYLVLDTPGGSVFSGMEFIDHLRAVPQKIQTVTLFAASMGFQIVQNMDKRYITKSGTLMSHRASGGIEGQFNGEIETRYKKIKRVINYLDTIAATRMKLSLLEYRKLIKDEYWVYGFDADRENAADEIVAVSCGKSLQGTMQKELETLVGPAVVTFSRCPLIRSPIKTDFSRLTGTKIQNENARNVIKLLFTQQAKYVEDYILTGKHFKYFYQ